MAEIADDLLQDAGELAERFRVRKHRYQEARACGLSIVEARLFAESEADVGELRRLRELGCPPQLIRRIIL